MDSKAIIEAIEDGNVEAIDKYIKSGGDINKPTHIGLTPLRFALGFSNLANYVKDNKYTNDDVIIYLINQGSDLNQRHLYGQTTLMAALSFNRSYEIIHTLINSGCDVNAVCNSELTPLMYAISYKNNNKLKIIKELIDKGANVNYYCSGGTPLLYALECDCELDVILTLISAGANVNSVCRFDRTLLMAIGCDRKSCSEDNCVTKEIISILLNNGINIKKIDRFGNNVLHYTNCFYIMALCIKSGISIDCKSHNGRGYNALMRAISVYDDRLVKFILDHGSNPNLIDSDILGMRLLNNTNCDVLSLLVYYGLNLFVRREINKEGLTYNDIHEVEVKKSFIKNFFLFFNGKKFQDYFDDSDLKKFTTDCISAIKKLREIKISDCLTFHDFCILKKLYNDDYIDLSFNPSICAHRFYVMEKHITSFSLLTKLFNELTTLVFGPGYQTLSLKDIEMHIKSLFPIYHNIIIIRIQENYKKKLKRELNRRLENVILSPVACSDVDEDIALSYDCLFEISRFLSYNSLNNLFLASIY